MSQIRVHFTPGEDIEPIVIGLILDAKKTIRLQGYGFTAKGIADALIAAHVRGVDVSLILDGPNETEKYSQGRRVTEAGIPVLYDRSHAIQHNKVIVVDSEVSVTGSYNWTEGARRSNAENIAVIRSAEVAAAYTANWNFHASHSLPPGSNKGQALLGSRDGDREYGDDESAQWQA